MEMNDADYLEKIALEILPALRKGLLSEIEIALKRGGGKDFQEASERLRSGDSLLEQAVFLWRGKQTPLNAVSETQFFDGSNNFISEKKRGQVARSKWIVATKLGAKLTHFKGALYRNGRGEIVGIAYAKETDKPKNRWFAGLQEKKFVPNEKFQSVILLCESMDGMLNAVCLPRDLIAKYRERFSKSHGQVKFMVVKRAGSWLLSVPDVVPDISVTGNINNHALVI